MTFCSVSARSLFLSLCHSLITLSLALSHSVTLSHSCSLCLFLFLSLSLITWLVKSTPAATDVIVI